MKVSAFITARNHGKYVRQAVESLLTQTRVPDEILLIDDGSTDNTSEVMRGLANNSRIRFHRSEPKGHIWQYNYAIDTTRHEFVHLMAADDYLLIPTFYQDALSLMAPDVGFVTGGLVQGDEFGNIPESVRERVHCWPPNDLYGVRPSKMALEYLLEKGNFVNGGCTLCRRSALRGVKQPAYDPGFPFAADFLLWVRILAKRWKAGFLGGDYYFYRRHRDGNQMTGNGRQASAEEIMKIHQELLGAL